MSEISDLMMIGGGPAGYLLRNAIERRRVEREVISPRRMFS